MMPDNLFNVHDFEYMLYSNIFQSEHLTKTDTRYIIKNNSHPITENDLKEK